MNEPCIRLFYKDTVPCTWVTNHAQYVLYIFTHYFKEMLNRVQPFPFSAQEKKEKKPHLHCRPVLPPCCSETSPPTPISAPSLHNYNDRQSERQHVLQALLIQTRGITVSASRWVRQGCKQQQGREMRS